MTNMENTIAFNDNDYIFKEKEPADYVFQIISGYVDLFYRNRFKERLKVGDYIGFEGIVVGKTTYEFTAKAVDKTELLPIYHSDFLEKVKQDEKVGLYISKRVTSSLFAEPQKHHKITENTVPEKKSLTDKVNFENLGINHSIVKVENNPPASVSNETTKRKNIISDIFKEPEENENLRNKEDFLVLVSKIEGDETGVCKEWILESLKNIPKNRVFGIENAVSVKTPISQGIINAKNLVESFKANCLIWGGIDENERVIELHFTSSEDPYYNDGLGFAATNAIYIPLVNGNEYYRILRAAVLGAISTRTKTQCENLSLLLEDALMKAHVLLENTNNLSSKEHASNLIAYANSCFKKGFFDKHGQKYLNEAISIYGLALRLLTDNDSKLTAFVNHQLGRIYNLKSLKNNNSDDLNKAVLFFEIAAKTTPKEITPFLWANINFKLGELYFKLANKENKEDLYYKAVNALNGCALVYTAETDPHRWAEIVNFIAKILFTHGEEYKNNDEIENGINMCKSALTVRTKDNMPILWANTTVNMASGLFLLGKNKKDVAVIYDAKQKFFDAREVYEKLALHTQTTTADKNINIIDFYLEEMQKDEDFARRLKSKKQTIFDALDNVDFSVDRDESAQKEDEDRRDIGEF